MGKFTSFTAANPCTVCGGHEDCRSTHDPAYKYPITFCFTKKSELDDAPGHRFNGISDECGSPGKWLVNDRDYKPLSEADRTAAAEKSARKAEAEAAKIANNQPVPERDRRYRHAAIAYGIKPKHSQNLADRGFTPEQSARWLHHSENACDGFGIVAPIFNEDGQAIGAQFRRDVIPTGKTNRYRWHEGNGKQKLPDLAELPLAWCEPEQVTHTALVIAEGTSFKPQLVSQSLGAIVIGASGGNFGSCRQQFRRYLDHARDHFGLTQIEIAVDSASHRNKNVTRNYGRAVTIAAEAGFDCRVIWYGQTLKKSEGGKDPDEIPADQLIAADRITWQDFESMAAEATKPAEVTKLAAVSEATEQSIALHFHNFPIAIDIDSEFLPENFYRSIPRSGVVAIESRKSSGKSKAILKPIIAEFKAAKKSIFSAHSRLSLVFEQCRKFDLLTPKEAEARRREIDLAVAACIDSLLKFSGRKYDLIVLDEIRSLLSHLCLSTTSVSRYRGKIYDAFIEMIRECVAGGGLVIAADADLGKIELDFLAEASGVKPFVILNRSIGQRRSATIHGGSWDALVKKILVKIGQGLKPAIVSDSQSKLETIARKIAKAYPHLAAKIVRCDRKTSAEDDIRSLLANPDQEIADRDIWVLLWSPSVSVGVSIEQQHFDEVYAFYGGVIAPTPFRQQLARYRPHVPLHLWIDSKAPKLEFGGSIDASEIARSISSKPKSKDLLLENAIKDALEECGKFGEIASRDQFLAALARAIDPENPLTMLSAKLIARENSERSDYRRQLIKELRERENFEIIEAETATATELKAELKEIKTEITAAEAEVMAIGAGDDSISENEVFAALSEGNLKHDESLKMQGRKLHFDLPGVELNAENIAALTEDNGHYYAALKMRAMMSVPEYAEARDTKSIGFMLSKSLQGIAAANDVRLYSEKIEFFDHSGIFELGQSQSEFDANSIAPIAEYCSENASKIKQLFGLDFSEGNPIRCIKSLLSRLGYEARQSRREKNHRYYQCQSPSEFEAAAAEAIERRYRSKIEPAAEVPAATHPPGAIEPEREERIEPEPKLSKAEALALMVEDQRRRRRSIEALDSWLERCADKFGDASIMADGWEALAEANLIAA
jgi:hypothetical protein